MNALSQEALRAGPLPADDVKWCERAIARWAGSTASILDVCRLPARTTTLYRVTTRVRGQILRFYLKIYPPSTQLADVTTRCAAIERIADAIKAVDGLLPYEIVDHDAAGGLVLTAETAGRSLARMQRPIIWSPRVRAEAMEAWRGIGRWLRTLHWHSLAPLESASRPAELVDYTMTRFRLWADQDSARRSLGKRAEDALDVLSRALEARSVTLTPCHADVSEGNIVVGRGVGLIDLDDFRFDMPALDLSQALLELDQFWRLASTVPMRGLKARATMNLRDGYGSPFAEGPEFWLPHLRNLSVQVVTLAARRTGMSASRLSNELHYQRTIRELSASIKCVKATQGHGNYFRRA